MIRAFIADAPARAFVLNHYGHTSSHPCSKCWIIGHRCTNPLFSGTMVFVGVENRLRADQEYLRMDDEDHHKGESLLGRIIRLVSQVPQEGMHSVHIGNVDRFLQAHLLGRFGCQRLNWRKIEILDARMNLLTEFCPSEFNRRPNKMSQFKHYKATENRQLLMYTYPAVFEHILPDEFYENFLILHLVIRILNFDTVNPQVLPFCQGALQLYVQRCEELYGEQYVVFNVHCLLHLVEDVARFGSLDSFSAFAFENAMPQFKKDQRKPGQNLEQFYKRLLERNENVLPPANDEIRNRLSQSHVKGLLPREINAIYCNQYRKLELGFFTFSRSQRDNCCILRNGDICLIQNILGIDEEIFFIVHKFRDLGSFYDVGHTSDFVGLFLASNLSNELDVVNVHQIQAKCYRMPRWVGAEGEEENTICDEFICVALLTPLRFPPGFN